MRRLALGIALSLWLAAPAAADTLDAGGLRLVPVGAFNQPIQALGAPGDDTRVFVVQKGGEIRVVGPGGSSVFLTLSGVKYDPGSEQGLLSMAFAPDYASSGRFYVYFNDATSCTGDFCDVRVDEFRRASADRADTATRRLVFRVAHREAANHNGGQIAFGPDGLLYAAPGDGGGADDPGCDAQRSDSLLGKLLRIDPVTGAAPQIYALGLRNPYRFSFDRLTGDLLLGDVGQGAQEEIDFLPAGAAPGANFGWNRYEGTAPYRTNCIATTPDRYVGPVLTYANPVGAPAAVTGGVVVRDTSVSALLGRYLYADFYAGEIRSAVVGAGGASGDGSTGLLVGSLAAFGEDSRCRVYVASLAGPVYRLEAAQPAGAPG
ncbi:MAG TPA: PQQ-dependent sugar dehydrogenase, partial [Solirubrobacteraceae bacterium]|nr:PQQ-dependent sugar dehydrogenase [Solirubrobacteraceae bacterium]